MSKKHKKKEGTGIFLLLVYFVGWSGKTVAKMDHQEGAKMTLEPNAPRHTVGFR